MNRPLIVNRICDGYIDCPNGIDEDGTLGESRDSEAARLPYQKYNLEWTHIDAKTSKLEECRDNLNIRLICVTVV